MPTAIRAEIGRQLREHYGFNSGPISRRLAQLVARIEQDECQSERLPSGGHPMSKQDEYLANARECERLAEIAHNPDERAAWLQMAQQWLRGAKERATDPSSIGKS
jgi:hypothetical protein